MTYKQIQQLDYVQLTYEQFLFTCAKNYRKPVRILRFDSRQDRITLLILCKTASDNIATRRMTFTKEGADTVVKNLQNDFKDIELQELDDLM